ncbi:MAG: mechanosensitive ion channel [Salinisphaeraceae bacterium]|nr:mechanosensitive ion channel [Salinisphaeraceae bacterium]
MTAPESNGWQELFSLTYQQTLQQVTEFLPKLFGALLILLVGWFIAALLSRAAKVGIRLLEKSLYRLSPKLLPKAAPNVRERHVNVIGKVVFWLVMLFFIALCANNLGLDLVSRWMSELITFLPHLAAGLLIIVGGYLISNVVYMMTVSAAESAGLTQAHLIGRSVQVTVFVTAAVIGVEQFGINLQFLTQFFIVIAAVLVAGFSLAFAMGSRDLIANVVGSQQATRILQLGDEVRIREIEGVVVEVTASLIVLESPEGRVTIPAGQFMRDTCHIKSATQHKSPKATS